MQFSVILLDKIVTFAIFQNLYYTRLGVSQVNIMPITFSGARIYTHAKFQLSSLKIVAVHSEETNKLTETKIFIR